MGRGLKSWVCSSGSRLLAEQLKSIMQTDYDDNCCCGKATNCAIATGFDVATTSVPRDVIRDQSCHRNHSRKVRRVLESSTSRRNGYQLGRLKEERGGGGMVGNPPASRLQKAESFIT